MLQCHKNWPDIKRVSNKHTNLIAKWSKFRAKTTGFARYRRLTNPLKTLALAGRLNDNSTNEVKALPARC